MLSWSYCLSAPEQGMMSCLPLAHKSVDLLQAVYLALLLQDEQLAIANQDHTGQHGLLTLKKDEYYWMKPSATQGGWLLGHDGDGNSGRVLAVCFTRSQDLLCMVWLSRVEPYGHCDHFCCIQHACKPFAYESGLHHSNGVMHALQHLHVSCCAQ